jgi:hypothetical protein
VAQRFFAVDGEAGVQRRQHVLAVQVDGRGDHDGVEIAALEQRPVIGEALHGRAHGRAHDLGQLLEAVRVHVAGGGEADAGHALELAHQLLAAAAGADDAQAQGALGGSGARARPRQHRRRTRQGRGHQPASGEAHEGRG